MLCIARADGAAPRPGRAQGAVHEPCSLSGGADSSARRELVGQTAHRVVGLAIGGDPLGGTAAGVHDLARHLRQSGADICAPPDR